MSTEQTPADTSFDPLLKVLAFLVQLLVGLVALYVGLIAVVRFEHGDLGYGLAYGAVSAVAGFGFLRLRRWSARRWSGPLLVKVAAFAERAVQNSERLPKQSRPGSVQKLRTLGGIVLALVVTALLAFVATVGGSSLEDHYRTLDGLCNGAYQSGLATSTSDNVHCSLYTTLYSVGDLLHIGGIIVLIGAVIGFAVMLLGRKPIV